MEDDIGGSKRYCIGLNRLQQDMPFLAIFSKISISVWHHELFGGQLEG